MSGARRSKRAAREPQEVAAPDNGLAVDTRELVGLLDDLLRTASSDSWMPMLHGVMLHTVVHKGTTVLVGTSTDRSRAGQASVPIAGGGFDRPVFLRSGLVRQLCAALRPYVKGATVGIVPRCTVAVDDENVRVQQAPIDDTWLATSLVLPHSASDGFPRSIGKLLRGEEYAASDDAVTLDPKKLEAFTAIARRRDAHVRIQFNGAVKPAQVFIGERYVGLCMPLRAEESGKGSGGADVFDLPAKSGDAEVAA